MNPISMPSRLNSMPDDMEAQYLAPAQHQPSSAKNTALKVGATALCGAALAAAMTSTCSGRLFSAHTDAGWQ